MKVLCTSCPCRNTGYEEGSKCNLGFIMDYAKQKDETWQYCSNNCNLISISYGDTLLIKKQFEADES